MSYVDRRMSPNNIYELIKSYIDSKKLIKNRNTKSIFIKCITFHKYYKT